MNLTGQLIDGIEDMKGIWLESSSQLEHRSGIVRIGSHDSEKLHQQLQERQIPTTYRFNGLRISPHFYNTCEEVETFLTTLQELSGWSVFWLLTTHMKWKLCYHFKSLRNSSRESPLCWIIEIRVPLGMGSFRGMMTKWGFPSESFLTRVVWLPFHLIGAYWK